MKRKGKILGRTRRTITYHGRKGHPVVHQDEKGRKFIMVRKRGGGVKRLYEGSKYRENGATKRLKL